MDFVLRIAKVAFRIIDQIMPKLGAGPFPSNLQRFNEAGRAQAAGRYGQAIDLYQQILKVDGKNLAALAELTRAATFARDMRLAIDSAERIMAIAGGDKTVAKVAASAFLRFNRPDRALNAVAKHVANSRDQELLQQAFETYYQLNRAPEAKKAAAAMLEADADDPVGLFSMGRVLDTPSQRQEAAAFYLRSIGTGQAPAAAYVSHAWVERFTEYPAYYEDLIGRAELGSVPDRSTLLVAAGKINADLGNHDVAFEMFLNSKRLFAPKSGLPTYREQIERFEQHFDHTFFLNRRNLGSSSERPVFVFGMPRSGTTLVEQILTAHPEVAGAGELMFFRHEVANLTRGTASVDSFLERASALRQRDVANIASDYLSFLRTFDPAARRVVDKMPDNFERLWLMALTFPKAKFIHCRRDPMATCVSCLVNPLSSKHAYTSDLEMLGHYYRSYERLMDHWRSVLPVEILEIDYEELVASFESEARRLVSFIGLEWHSNCLEFHEQERLVLTPSRQQVARGVYKGANDGWRRYERHLGPLLKALDRTESGPPH